MKSSKWFCAASLVCLCECVGTETGNPVHEQDVHVAFAPLAVRTPREDLGEVRFEAVSIDIASVSLVPCPDGESIQLLGDRSVDLFADEGRAARIPAGTYCALIVGIGSGADSFAASRQISGGRTALTFDSRLRAEVRLELIEPLATGRGRPSWLLGVDLAAWLDPIDAWLVGNDSELVLNDDATMALRRAQATSLRLYQDIDGDRQLDAADIDAPLSDPGSLIF